jgi:hypothetical protein
MAKKTYIDKKTGKRKKSMYADLDEGAFTKKAKRAGRTVQEHASSVVKNPKKHTGKTRKQAQFAKTQKKIAKKRK